MDNEIFNENEVQPTPVQPVPTAEPVPVEEVAPIAEPAVVEAPVEAPVAAPVAAPEEAPVAAPVEVPAIPQEPAPYAPEQPAEQPWQGQPTYPQQPPYAPQQPTYVPQQPTYNAPQQPYYGAPQQPYYGAPQQDPNYMPPAPVKKKKSIFARWWFWVILVVLILGFFGCVGACSSSDSGSGSSGGSGGSGTSTYVPSVSPYVTMVKTAKNSNYGITYGAAFDDFFTNPSWRYFTATTGEHVVEFTGGFLYDGSPATAKVQFIVDTAEGTLQVYHLSINGVDQSKLVLAALVKKVFESY